MALIAIIGGIPLFSATPINIYAIIIIYNHIYIYRGIIYIFIYIYTIHDIPMDCHPHWSLGHPSIPRSPGSGLGRLEAIAQGRRTLGGVTGQSDIGFFWIIHGIIMGF
jgi:hypothetical protein